MATEDDLDVPALSDDDMELEDEVEGIGWAEDDGDEDEDLLVGPVKCLFCERILNSSKEVFSHCVSDHSFNVPAYCGQWSLDCIGYIKLVNFIRKQHPSPESLRHLQLGKGAAPWNDDSFMRPTDPDDLLLQFDIESEDYSIGEMPVKSGESPSSASGCSIAQADEEIVIKASELQALLQRVSDAEAKAAAFEADLQRAVGDLNAIRKTAQGLIASDPLWGPKKQTGRGDSSCTDVNGDPVGAVQRLTLTEDEGYFSSYANVDIHIEMLQDKVRSESYRDFMLGNPEVFQDKVVLDIGCGTGILSMFAAKAGARQVIGVDQSDIIYSAMDIARENGLENKITFLKGKMEEVKLPVDQVDVIISEWMGYFLLFESMMDTVIVARDKYLTPGGQVYPDKCSMWLAGFSDTKLREKVVDYWDDVYGFKMTCMKGDVISQTAVDIIDSDKIITAPALIKELDVRNSSLADVDFVSTFTMTCCRDGVLHGLVGYFDIGFEAGCSKQVHFSTGPASTSTHWKQTHFLLKTPVPLTAGTSLEGRIEVRKNLEDPRSLNITLTLGGRSQDFFMD